MNYCHTCGVERHPVAKPGNCQACHMKLHREFYNAKFIKQIEELGFKFGHFISGVGSHQKVKVTNLACGHMFVAKANNIISRRTICGECGPTLRMKPAFNAWYEKNKRTYDIQKWYDYSDYVRFLSDQTYTLNKNMLNPMGLPRKKPNAHPDAVNLDHIIPIIYGFKNGLSPELLADVRNLRIVKARTNLKKKQRLTQEAEQLLLSWSNSDL